MSPTELHTQPDTLQRQRLIEAVVDEFEQPLLRYVMRIIRNGTLAQDVVQNVFIKLFRQWEPNQRPSASLKPWLLRVAHNEAVDVIRAEERRKALHRKWGEEVARHVPVTLSTAGTSCAPPEDERMEMVFASLDILTLEERQIVLLRLQQGLSYEEIAVVTRRPRGSVGAMLHVAVRKLADALRSEEDL